MAKRLVFVVEAGTMRPQTQTRQFSQRTLQQVRADIDRALVRAGTSPETSQITQYHCVDNHDETERHFGSQLWYFEGLGFRPSGHRRPIYGILEYSLQFGLSEVMEDGVFDSAGQRDRFRAHYHREGQKAVWRHPAHRLLIAAIIAVALLTLVLFLIRRLVILA